MTPSPTRALIIVAPNYHLVEHYAHLHRLARQTFIFPYHRSLYAGRDHMTLIIVTGDRNGTFDWTLNSYHMREDALSYAEHHQYDVRYRKMEEPPS